MFGDLTTGAESDIQQLTRIARHMVGRWGMSRDDRPGRGAARRRHEPAAARASARPPSTPSSWSTRRCGGSSRPRTRRRSRCCAEHRSNLDSLVAALLEHETLDEADAYAAAGLPRNTAGRPEEAPRSALRAATVTAQSGRRPAKPGLGLVPEADLVLLVDQPAEVDLLAVAHRREVDQAALEVAQHDVDGLELADRAAQLDQRPRRLAPGVRAAGAARRAPRSPRALARRARPAARARRGPTPTRSATQPRHRVRLLERVVAFVVHRRPLGAAARASRRGASSAPAPRGTRPRAA